MDEATVTKLEQILKALKALSRSTHKALQSATYDGTGKMVVKSYRGLHGRVCELLPDDFFVTDSLVLEVADDADDRSMVGVVNMAADQLVTYLEGTIKESAPSRPTGDWEDLKSLGREIQDHVLGISRHTIKRAPF